MATATSFYNLVKSDENDFYDINVVNTNLDSIDTKLKEINDDRIFNLGTLSGSANAYTAINSDIAEYTINMGICGIINITSSGACTININGLGAKQILDAYGNALSSSNTLKANIPYTLRYNGTAFILQGKGGGGNATDSQVLSPYTYINNNGMSTGNIPSKSAQTFTPSTVNQTIASGQYLSGVQTISGDADLISANIKAGVNIFNIQGSSTVVDTADAVLDPAYLVTGYSGYDDGVKKAGTLPNLTGIRNATGTGLWGDGGLAVYPERGYQKGGSGDGEIKVTPAQLQSCEGTLTSSNIVSGQTIFGIAGSATIESLGGRKYASGSVGSSSSSITLAGTVGGTNRTVYTISVSGLNFTPSIITIIGNGVNVNQDGCLYNSAGGNYIITAYNSNSGTYGGNFASLGFNFGTGTNSSKISVNGGSFVLPVTVANQNYIWYAIE